MYIAVTRKGYKDTYYEQILLRESYRDHKDHGRVKTRTIANLTKQPARQVEAIAAALKGRDKITVIADNQKQGKSIGLSLIVVFIMKLLGMFTKLSKTYEAKTALVLIAARVAIQSSRIQALYWALNEDKILNLLHFSNDEKDRLNSKSIYSGLDYMQENQDRIEDKLFHAYCIIRSHSDTHFGNIRTPVSEFIRTPFRSLFGHFCLNSEMQGRDRE